MRIANIKPSCDFCDFCDIDFGPGRGAHVHQTVMRPVLMLFSAATSLCERNPRIMLHVSRRDASLRTPATREPEKQRRG